MNTQNTNVQILEWSSEKKTFFPITSSNPSILDGNTESFNNYKHGGDSVSIGVFLLFISISILIILYFLWKHFICKHYISTAALPPTFHAASQMGDRYSNTPVVSFVHLISFRPNNLYQDDNNDLPIEIIANDQPPDYYEITKTDSSGRDAKLAEAISQTPETPPPKYEEVERY